MTCTSTRADSPLEAFRLAVSRAGGQIAFAKLAGRTQGAVSKRLSKGLPLWPEAVLDVEKATEVSRHDLRPDIYPIEADTVPPLSGAAGAGPALQSSRMHAGHLDGTARTAGGAA